MKIVNKVPRNNQFIYLLFFNYNQQSRLNEKNQSADQMSKNVCKGQLVVFFFFKTYLI